MNSLKKVFLVFALLLLPAQVGAASFNWYPTGVLPPPNPLLPYEYIQQRDEIKTHIDTCKAVWDVVAALPVDTAVDPNGENVLSTWVLNTRNLSVVSCQNATTQMIELQNRLIQSGYNYFGPVTAP